MKYTCATLCAISRALGWAICTLLCLLLVGSDEMENQSEVEESVISHRPRATVGAQQSVVATGRWPVVLQVLGGSTTSHDQSESLSLKKV